MVWVAMTALVIQRSAACGSFWFLPLTSTPILLAWSVKVDRGPSSSFPLLSVYLGLWRGRCRKKRFSSQVPSVLSVLPGSYSASSFPCATGCRRGTALSSIWLICACSHSGSSGGVRSLRPALHPFPQPLHRCTLFASRSWPNICPEQWPWAAPYIDVLSARRGRLLQSKFQPHPDLLPCMTLSAPLFPLQAHPAGLAHLRPRDLFPVVLLKGTLFQALHLHPRGLSLLCWQVGRG